MKRLLMFTILLALSSTLFAQIKELKLTVSEQHLRGSAARCDLKNLKKILVDRTTYEDLDPNATLDEYGNTAFNMAAISMSNKKCRNVARWLSDFGIRDGQIGGGECICRVSTI